LSSSFMEECLSDTLKTRFNLTSLYPYQELVINNIMQAKSGYRNQLVILPTGSGKSICFMLPALLLPNLTLIVYPLLSLMNDQLRRIENIGGSAVVLKGGQTTAERRTIWQALQSGTVKFILTNPETLGNPSIIRQLRPFTFSLMVIDEAHAVVQWGKSFRPSYLELPPVIRSLEPERLIAFTATASKEIIEGLAKDLFNGEKFHLIRGNPDRPNISYKVYPTLSKLHTAEMLITTGLPQPALFFCATRKRTEQFAFLLQERLPQVAIKYYHAGLAKKERDKIEKWFFAQEAALLFSTSAYGLGVDKPNIRSVVHIDLSGDIESYLQESGRGGRDGKACEAYVLLDGKERASPLLEVMRGGSKCRREALLALIGFESDSCAGCDVCNQKVIKRPEGLTQILSFLRYYPLCYTQRQLIALLCGVPSESMILKGNPFFSILNTWQPRDLKEALDKLKEAKIIKAFTRREVLILSSNSPDGQLFPP